MNNTVKYSHILILFILILYGYLVFLIGESISDLIYIIARGDYITTQQQLGCEVHIPMSKILKGISMNVGGCTAVVDDDISPTTTTWQFHNYGADIQQPCFTKPLKEVTYGEMVSARNCQINDVQTNSFIHLKDPSNEN